MLVRELNRSAKTDVRALGFCEGHDQHLAPLATALQPAAGLEVGKKKCLYATMSLSHFLFPLCHFSVPGSSLSLSQIQLGSLGSAVSLLQLLWAKIGRQTVSGAF